MSKRKRRPDLRAKIPFPHLLRDPICRSDSLGVHPRQIPEAKAYAAELGCEVDYEPDGTAVMKRSERGKYLDRLARAKPNQPRIVDYNQGFTI